RAALSRRLAARRPHAEALDRRPAAQPGRADRAHPQRVASVPDPVAQRRAAGPVATPVPLAFEPPGLGRRVEAKAGAEAVPAGNCCLPEVLGEDEDRARAPAGPTAAPGRVTGSREGIGGGEDAALDADQRAERGRGAGGPEKGVPRLAFRAFGVLEG